MVAHRMTKNLKYLGIEYLFLILSYNDENIEQLLYFWGTEIVPCRLIKSIQVFLILMFLIVSTRTHYYDSNICTG